MTTPQQPDRSDRPDFLKLLIDELDKALSKARTTERPPVLSLIDMFLSPPTPSSPYDDPRAPSPHVAHPPDTAAQAQAQFDARANTEETSRLPTLRAGVYRHFKGGLYQVLGYARDAEPPTHDPERVSVVYVALKPASHTPHAMWHRPVQHFFDQVCTNSGKSLSKCTYHLSSAECDLTDRFTYVGPEYPA